MDAQIRIACRKAEKFRAQELGVAIRAMLCLKIKRKRAFGSHDWKWRLRGGSERLPGYTSTGEDRIGRWDEFSGCSRARLGIALRAGARELRLRASQGEETDVEAEVMLGQDGEAEEQLGPERDGILYEDDGRTGATGREYWVGASRDGRSKSIRAHIHAMSHSIIVGYFNFDGAQLTHLHDSYLLVNNCNIKDLNVIQKFRL